MVFWAWIDVKVWDTNYMYTVGIVTGNSEAVLLSVSLLVSTCVLIDQFSEAVLDVINMPCDSLWSSLNVESK